MNDIQKHFEQNSYVVIKEVLPLDMCELLYRYTKVKTVSNDHKRTYYPELTSKIWDGDWQSLQAPGIHSVYGDPLFDSLLFLLHPKMEYFIGTKLNYQYSYWRLYQHGSVLDKHKDRISCEISTTLCLGWDSRNLNDENYNWNINLEDENENEISVNLNPGDMLIYRGNKLFHWRDKFEGLNHSQVFLHYTDPNTDNRVYDGREGLGLPPTQYAKRKIQ